MRLILILILIVFQLTGVCQKITGKFDNIVSEDDFTGITGKWEQRSTANDFYITETGNYIVKNRNLEMFSISAHQPVLLLSKFSVSAVLKADASKQTDASIGVMLNLNSEGTGAIVCEINSKYQYRVRKFINGQWAILSFAGDNGWNNDKAIKNKAFNTIMVNHEGGVFDFYINSIFIFSFTDKKLVSGNVGIFVSANASGKVDNIRITKEAADSIVVISNNPILNPIIIPVENSANDNEVVLLLKSKIDKQQKKITELTKDLEKCNGKKNVDTTLEIKNIELTQLNEALLIQKGKLEIDLQQAKEKLAEFEIIKKTIEDNANGDIILLLNDIITREKKKNKESETNNRILADENKQLLEIIKGLQKK